MGTVGMKALKIARLSRTISSPNLLTEQKEGWFGVQGFDFEVLRDDGEERKREFVRYDLKSLYLFHADTKFRIAVVRFIEWVWFERAITLVIIANSVSLCFQDNRARYYGEEYVSLTN